MPPQNSDHEQEKIERLRRAMYSRSLSDKLKDKPRRELGEIEPLVPENFKSHEEGVAGTVVAPRTIGLARSALWWALAASVIFFVAAISYFAYYFLLGGGSLRASPGNIDISISGPPQITSGEPSELQITVVNRNNIPLQLAELLITYPEGTRSPTDFSTPLPSQRISLGDIDPGGQRQGTIRAVLAGGKGTPATIKAELEYHLPNTSAIFTASSIYDVPFSSSALSVDVTGNNETTSGQPIELTVDVASNAAAPLTDVVLAAQYPFGFKFKSATPEPKSGGFWELGNLLPGQKRTVTIRGTLAGERGDERVFHFTAGTRDTPDKKTVTTTLGADEFALTITRPFLGLAITINGSSEPTVVLSAGETAKVTIGWQNNLTTPVTNAVIAARLSGTEIDGSTVLTTDGFYRSSDNVVLWDKSTTGGALADLAPGAHGSVAFSFQTPKELTGLRNPRLTISVNAAGNRVSEAGVPESLQSTVQRTLALASDLQITTQGLYYANPYGSVGPMPPKAGSETTYAVIFTVMNTTNRITNAKVTAQLPPYVRWTGVYSPPSEKLSFNSETGLVTWDLGTVDPGVGMNGAVPRQAGISIGFTPSTSQIGQQPVLIQGVTLTGTDAATGETITRTTQPDLTTNLTQVSKSTDTLATTPDPGFSAANATVVK